MQTRFSSSNDICTQENPMLLLQIKVASSMHITQLLDGTPAIH